MIQLKSADFKLKEVDPKGTVIFIASSFGVEDAQNDIILKGSYRKTLQESFSRLKYLYNHNREKIIGVPVEAYENDTGLIVKAALNLDKELGNDTYLDYKMSLDYGRSVEHSVAIRVVKSTGRGPRYVSEVALGEVSYVPFRGANSQTPLLELKSEDKQFIEHCYNAGGYSCERMELMEALLKKEPSKDTQTAVDELNIFFKHLKF